MAQFKFTLTSKGKPDFSDDTIYIHEHLARRAMITAAHEKKAEYGFAKFWVRYNEGAWQLINGYLINP